jgi:hypothetical protein
MIEDAVQEILMKDFLVSVVKSAFPTAPAGGIAEGRAGKAEGRDDVERAKVRRFKKLINYRETIRQSSSSVVLKRTCSNFEQSQMSTPK